MDFQSVGANLFRRTGSPSYPKNKLFQTTTFEKLRNGLRGSRTIIVVVWNSGVVCPLGIDNTLLPAKVLA
jgi:hypothetical protein